MNAHHLLAWLTLVGYVFFGALVLYWVSYPYDVLTFNDIQVSPTVEPGGILTIRWDFCKHTNQPGTIHRSLYDGYVYQLAPAHTSTPRGCHIQTEQVQLKDFMPAGSYRYVGTACYNVNPLREVCVNYETPSFTVR